MKERARRLTGIAANALTELVARTEERVRAETVPSRLLIYTLTASIALHATLLAIQFRPVNPAKLWDRTPPLEVALVNAKSKTKPTKAEVLAQANLDGGGNTDLPRQAKTPLPV